MKAVGATFTRSAPSQSDASASWPYPFLKWNGGKTYGVGDETVPADQVGEELGEVKRELSDVIVTREGEEPVPYEEKDGDSNVLAAGSKLYALKGTDDDSVIVVLSGDRYIKASLITPSQQSGSQE